MPTLPPHVCIVLSVFFKAFKGGENETKFACKGHIVIGPKLGGDMIDLNHTEIFHVVPPYR